MTHPFPCVGTPAGISVSVNGYDFLMPQDGSPDLFCQPYYLILIVTGQAAAEFKYL